MIDYLKGTVQEIRADSNKVVLDVSGVGYELNVTKSALLELGKNSPSEVKFFVWESPGGPYSGVISLYGFLTSRDRDVFLRLRSVKGIGSMDAVSILDKAGAGLDEFLSVVVRQDLKALQSLYGFKGKKAEKILSAFKYEKLPDTGGIAGGENENRKFLNDAFSALVNMGFREFEIREAVQSVSGEIKDRKTSFDDIFRLLLKKLKKA